MRHKNLNVLGTAVRVALALLLVNTTLLPVAAAQGSECPRWPGQWTQQFGNPERNFALGISVDASRVYVAGITEGALPGQTSAGDFDVFVRKYDGEGHELWTRQFGSQYSDAFNGIAVNASGVYVTGFAHGPLPGQTSGGVFVRKYDADGNEVWTRVFGVLFLGDQARGISVDASGVYVVGLAQSTLGQTSVGGYDAYLRKYDVDGNVVWTRQFGTPSSDGAHGISVDATGVYVLGNTYGAFPGQTSAGEGDVFVRKYDGDGNEVWTRQFGTPGSDGAHGISVDASEVYVAFDTHPLSGPLEDDAFVRKYDAEGNAVWTQQFGTPDLDEIRGISVDASGAYVVGYTRGTFSGHISAGGWDAFMRKYDAAGNEVWTQQFGTPSSDFVYGISAGAPGIYLVGSTGGTLPGQTSAGGEDAFAFKLESVTPDDSDDDGVFDACDACPDDPMNDADGDGICGDVDNCPAVANSNQLDTDGDSVGDACDPDDDGDGVADAADDCPLTSDPGQEDADGDGLGDACDTDDDDDAVSDDRDECPNSALGSIVDPFGCAIADYCPCALSESDWENHGAYVSCVTQVSDDFVAQQLITSTAKGAIDSQAAASSCGH